jgi:hypothetical protein
LEKKIINFGEYSGLSWELLSDEYLKGLKDMECEGAENELARRKNLPIENKLIGFGKHSRKPWIEADPQYLRWIIGTFGAEDQRSVDANIALDYIEKNIEAEEICSFEYQEEEVVIYVE